MFCFKCGTQLAEGAKVCMNCGSEVKDEGKEVHKSIQAETVKGFDQEKRTNGEAALDVEAEQRNNSEVNVEELLNKAREFETKEEYEEALEYYNKVLDMDHNTEEARKGANRVKQEINNYVYYQTSANNVFTPGTLQLKNGVLVYKGKMGNEAKYYLDEIYNVRKCRGSLAFTYGLKRMEVIYGCSEISQWIKVINQAHYGKYPKRGNRKLQMQ
ncbi:MAG: zinc ribbon domain-containing protein [bacterium]|nr:zinc ribbon domain-containing protein [bacterium]